jgi:hypothetical protein
MTTITIQFSRARSNRLAVLAMSLGVSLVMWAEERGLRSSDPEAQARLLSADAGVRDREQSALRLATFS